MRYMGSKSKLKKYILPIVLKDRQPNQTYVEPFIGGANTFVHVSNPRLGGDTNEHIVTLLCTGRDGWRPPEEFISKETYLYVKDHKTEFEPVYFAYIGFATSALGRLFSGYKHDHEYIRAKDGVESPSGITFRCVHKQFPMLIGSEIVNTSYNVLTIPDKSIIYCDPPYKDTKGYGKAFDHDKFWQWVRDKVAEGHKVFVSEFNAPEDFVCVWSKELTRKPLYGKTISIRTEKLFIHSSQTNSH